MYHALLLFPLVVFQYPFGRLSDKIGRAPLLFTGSLFYGLEMCLVCFVGKSALIARILSCGVFAAMMFPSSTALAGDISPPNKRGAAIGGFNVFGGLSEILVALIAIPILLKLGFGLRAIRSKNISK